MTFSIFPVEEPDIPRVTEIICEGLFQNGVREYVRATFPDPKTPEGLALARSRFSATRNRLSGKSAFLKVVDDSDGTIVACSVHMYYPKAPKDLPNLGNEGWASIDDRDYAHHLRRERNEMLLRIFSGLTGPITGTVKPIRSLD
jgi:hypothetical protein